MKKVISLYIVTIILTFIFSMFMAAMVQAEEKYEVPEDVRTISEELGKQYNICPEIIQAICWRESRFLADAENDGCIGIMQVSPKWHQDRMDRLGVTDLKDVRQNMTIAVDYLSDLVRDEEDMTEALMRYHGESRIQERLGTGELSGYVESILLLSAELEERHGK
ncbi:MAG: lytic transglycosylase domain-containing protein [Lachnospiraceae bacterium]|nr:lytic transglycosylase domain-containing protein [Lachnospiraceae bacterium]